jgi:hypothetical protein
MATYIPITDIPIQFFDDAGDPDVGGSLEFFLAGTTTATNAFSDNAGTSIGVSIVFNALGYPESGGNLITLFRDQSKALKIIRKDSVGATEWTMDDIPAVASFDSASSAKLSYITVTQAVDLDAMEASLGTAYQVDASVALTADITMPATFFVNDSTTAGITASITQTQLEGQLTSSLNEVATVTTALDTVTLPTAVIGRMVTIINNGASTLQVFPFTDDSIDAGAADAATTIRSGDVQVFRAITAVIWESMVSYSESTQAGITASATQTQGQVPLTASLNEVSVVSNLGDVVTLPTASAGRPCTVINNGANALGIFPASGDDLGTGVDTVDLLSVGSNATFKAYNDTNWEAV